jgi:prophage regulatory protein
MISRILKLPLVLNARGRSQSSHYMDIQQGLFTHQVSLGGRSVGWPAYEVETLNAARISGMTDDEIRVLVTKLEAERKELLCSEGQR